jgi:hypothetical protein
MTPKVFVIDFRPAAIPSAWNKTDDLILGYIETMKRASNNTLAYQIVSKTIVPDYPVLLDGRQYTDATWTQARQDDRSAIRDPHGSYMMADYQRIIQDFNLLRQIRDKVFDEIWMFGGPYFGFYESRMVGRGAFWCNAPAIEQPGRRFVMMGYNYERGVKEMVHNFGHRAESILCRQFGSQPFLQQLYRLQPISVCRNDYEEWLLGHGTVHRKPGGEEYGQDEVAWVTALKPIWFQLAVYPNLVNR